MPGGYEEIYQSLAQKLAGCDLEGCAQRMGWRYEDGAVRLDFLGRAYRIDHAGVEAKDGLPAHANTKSVLLYYLFSDGIGQPKHAFMPLHRMTGMPAGQNDLGGGFMEGQLVRELGHDYGKFAMAAEKTGGKCQPDEGAGKHVWSFGLLPKIPAQVVFYEADEEFPAEIQLLLDEHAPRFLEFECLAFLTGCLVHALGKTAQHGSATGWV